MIHLEIYTNSIFFFTVLKRQTELTGNVTAPLGGSIIMNCPFYSVPAANVTWKFANDQDVPLQLMGALNKQNRRVNVNLIAVFLLYIIFLQQFFFSL